MKKILKSKFFIWFLLLIFLSYYLYNFYLLSKINLPKCNEVEEWYCKWFFYLYDKEYYCEDLPEFSPDCFPRWYSYGKIPLINF